MIGSLLGVPNSLRMVREKRMRLAVEATETDFAGALRSRGAAVGIPTIVLIATAHHFA